MVVFYEELLAGRSKSLTLRHAMLAIEKALLRSPIGDPEWRTPTLPCDWLLDPWPASQTWGL